MALRISASNLEGQTSGREKLLERYEDFFKKDKELGCIIPLSRRTVLPIETNEKRTQKYYKRDYKVSVQ